MHSAFRTRLSLTDGATLGFGEPSTASAAAHDGVLVVVSLSANPS
jgi:hypothetical protein